MFPIEVTFAKEKKRFSLCNYDGYESEKDYEYSTFYDRMNEGLYE